MKRAPLSAGILLLLSVLSTVSVAQDSDLKAYTACNLGTDFQIVQVDGPVNDFSWPAPSRAGEVSIPVETGYRVLVTYRQDEPFGNLKVERIPEKEFVNVRANLLNSFDYLSSEPGMDPKIRTQAFNGLTFYGVDRNKLEGGVLSTYALFREDRNIVVSLYLLNAEPAERKFKTLEEYKAIRDKFLDAFSKCMAPAMPH